MPGMIPVSKKDLDQEHGEIQNLGSPILSKVQQAFIYMKTVPNGTPHEGFPSYRSIQGTAGQVMRSTMTVPGQQMSKHVLGNRCGSIHIGWNKDEARLVIVVKVSPAVQFLP